MQTANTLAAVVAKTHPLVAQIMDRNFVLSREFIRTVMRQSQFSWHGRKPKPALVRDSVRKTNLDLLSVLMELYYRKAEIELAAYENKLPWSVTAGEQHVGGTKRYGPIVGFAAHRELLSFSVTINDRSVFRAENGQFGAERNYMIADYDGSWHKGWHGLSWEMTEEEHAYFTRRKLLAENGVDFEDYIHQNRRQSVYGAPYLMAKLLWQRIEDEILFYEQELKRLEHFGVECPQELKEEPRHRIAVGNSTSKEVPTFIMEVKGPEFTGEYAAVSTDTVGYCLAYRLVRFLKYELRPLVQFLVRADEVAFYRFGLTQGFVAHWVPEASWQRDHLSRWTSMELATGLSLRYALGKTEVKVAA